MIYQTFLPSRRRDCHTNPSKTALSLEKHYRLCLLTNALRVSQNVANRQHPCLLMNALFVLRPAKLWAFNFGHPCPPSKKGEVLLLGQAEPTMVGIVNASVVFMVALLSISIPSHRTTPSKTELSHSLFVGRGACPSRNIIAIIENKLIEL